MPASLTSPVRNTIKDVLFTRTWYVTVDVTLLAVPLLVCLFSGFECSSGSMYLGDTWYLEEDDSFQLFFFFWWWWGLALAKQTLYHLGGIVLSL
jgi:hypothetical protein